ncbi:MAG: hypothetical protein Q9206_000164 [Seirophora lacunosa]
MTDRGRSCKPPQQQPQHRSLLLVVMAVPLAAIANQGLDVQLYTNLTAAIRAVQITLFDLIPENIYLTETIGGRLMRGINLFWAQSIHIKLLDSARGRWVARPVDPRSGNPIGPAHEFEVSLEPDIYSEEKYALFENYQRHVHKEGHGDISRPGFRRFLCSGMGQSSQLNDGVEQKLGSYHQCYRLNGRLVAIGVLDLLPGCVSSVYLMYHEDVDDWYFGKLSALREISLAVEGGYQYYYMGFYVHSCIKMRYKAQYQPSRILDLETYTWNLLDADHLARLSARNYVSMFLERQLHLPPHKITKMDELGLDEDSVVRLRDYQKECDPSWNSAFDAGMPGIMSLDEIREELELGRWIFKCGNMLAHLENLQEWTSGDIRDPASIKRVIAELAAALGPELAHQLVLNLG